MAAPTEAVTGRGQAESGRTARPLQWPVRIALVAVGLRLLYLALFVGPGYIPEFDAAEYDEIARSIAAGAGFALSDGTPTAIRPPLFPIVLAGVYTVFGRDNFAAGLVLQALIGAATAVVTYRVARRFGRLAAVLAGLIAAGYPLLIYAGGSLLSEPLFTLLVTCALAATLWLMEKPGWGRGAWLGVLFGLAGLARPNGLLLAPFLAGWALLTGNGTWRRRLGAVGVAALLTIAVTAPWVARNYRTFGAFIPSTTMGGGVLFGSYNQRILDEPALHGDWVSPCEVPGAGWTCELGEVERDAAWRELGMTFIRQHPAELPAMVWWRFVKFWHLYPFEHGFPENIGFWVYVAVAIAGVAGACMALTGRTTGGWRAAGALIAVVLCFMLSALLFWGGFRMRTPAEPALIVLASLPLAWLLQRVRVFASRPSRISE